VSDTAITASGLGKRYRLGETANNLRFDTLRDWVVGLLARGRRSAAAGDHIWALRDASFDIRTGEVVGIIGHNGAGKSTLLKILSRITDPTRGEAQIRGRVGSLLEVGTGFHPDLTGRENIFLNGAILGMKRAEIARKFDEIVAFAETEAFLDTPVRRYSSGMYMRLAFAVAAHLEPETLIVDEVLAMGDAAFQKKCLGKMGDVARTGRTVLFVSHNMAAVRTLCTRALVMTSGTVRFDGAPDDAIAYYLAHAGPRGGDEEGRVRLDPAAAPPADLHIREIRLCDRAGTVRALFDSTDAIRVEIDYEVTAPLRGARTVLAISTQEGDAAFVSTDHLARDPVQVPGRYTTSCTIPGALLNCRVYVVGVSFEIPWVRPIVPRRDYLSFTISGGGNHGSTSPERWPGVVCPALVWETERP
jgi:lipopolysaccharide transport system ATP-binding protein